MQIGFVGLGLWAPPLARNLIRAGKNVLVADADREAVRRVLAAGGTARPMASRDELAGCGLVFTCLPLARHVEGGLFEPGGPLEHLAPGAILVDISSIGPQTSVRLEAAVRARGCRFLQCTLGKTPAQAEVAGSPLFIGGETAAFDELAAIWPLLGVPAYYMGTVEAACAFKLISNMVSLTNLAVLAEGLRIGEKAGIERKVLLDLLRDTEGRSYQMDVRGPWIVNDDFVKRLGLDHGLEDLRLGCAMAAAWGMKIPAMMAALSVFMRASAVGLGEDDCCSVYNVTE